MQVSIESSTGLERQLKIGVPADKIDQEVIRSFAEGHQDCFH